MSKKLQYPNKPHLVKFAIKHFDNYFSFGLVGFRAFNTKNSHHLQKFAIQQRIKSTNYSLRKPTLLILCYLTKQSKKLDVPDSILREIEQETPNLKLITEKELESYLVVDPNPPILSSPTK